MIQPRPETIDREKDKLRQELLASYIYDAERGIFLRRFSGGGQKAGSIAGTVNAGGYLYIRVGKRQCLQHRMAWLYMHGDLPDYLDHLNGNPGDNRISNLRPATYSENGANQRKHRDGANPHKGVYQTKYGRWQAKILVQGKRLHLGNFQTKEEALTAYGAAAQKHFGAFGRSE